MSFRRLLPYTCYTGLATDWLGPSELYMIQKILEYAIIILILPKY